MGGGVPLGALLAVVAGELELQLLDLLAGGVEAQGARAACAVHGVWRAGDGGGVPR